MVVVMIRKTVGNDNGTVPSLRFSSDPSSPVVAAQEQEQEQQQQQDVVVIPPQVQQTPKNNNKHWRRVVLSLSLSRMKQILLFLVVCVASCLGWYTFKYGYTATVTNTPLYSQQQQQKQQQQKQQQQKQQTNHNLEHDRQRFRFHHDGHHPLFREGRRNVKNKEEEEDHYPHYHHLYGQKTNKKTMATTTKTMQTTTSPLVSTAKQQQQQQIVLEQIIQGHLHLIDLEPNPHVLKQFVQEQQQQSQSSFLVHSNSTTSMVDVDVIVNYPHLFRASFCHLNWTSHEQNPSQTPMFRFVVAQSHCTQQQRNNNNNIYKLDLYTVVQAIRAYEQQEQQQHKQQQQQQDSMVPIVRSLPIQGVVFHESRCGSTLVANLLQLHNPNENLVYSESQPPHVVLRAFMSFFLTRTTTTRRTRTRTNKSVAKEISTSFPPGILQVVRDVIYLMTRTSNPMKRRVFFKFQSMATLTLPLFRAAFPHIHWIYVYRNPIEVLMSQLSQQQQQPYNAPPCVKSQPRNEDEPVPFHIQNVMTKLASRHHHRQQQDQDQQQDQRQEEQQQHGPMLSEMEYDILEQDPRTFNIPYYCAAHLASLTEMAAQELSQQQEQQHSSSYPYHNPPPPPLGVAVNYRDLPNILIDYIWPQLWNMTITTTDDTMTLQRLQQGSQSYSKGGGGGGSNNNNKNQNGPFLPPQERQQQEQQTNKDKETASLSLSSSSSSKSFTSDSQSKQEHASIQVKRAAQIFLQPSYQILENLSSSWQQQQEQQQE